MIGAMVAGDPYTMKSSEWTYDKNGNCLFFGNYFYGNYVFFCEKKKN